jgi:hypothetical protein
LSVAVAALKLTGMLHDPDAALTEILAGHVMTGFSESVTVTVNDWLVIFPYVSVARNVTVVVPTGKKSPEEGPLVRVTLATPQASVATGVT